VNSEPTGRKIFRPVSLNGAPHKRGGLSISAARAILLSQAEVIL